MGTGILIGGALALGAYGLFKLFSSKEQPIKEEAKPEKSVYPTEEVKIDKNYENILVDPISQELMTEPVFIDCGHTFDLSSIRAWLQRNSTCPICRKPVDKKSMKPNYTVRDIIERETFKSKNQ